MRKFEIVFETGKIKTITAECMSITNDTVVFSDSPDNLRAGLFTAMFCKVEGETIKKVTSEKVDMTQQEKQAECDRICGPYYSEKSRKEQGLHSSAPVMCPILEDMWKSPKKKNDYVGVN